MKKLPKTASILCEVYLAQKAEQSLHAKLARGAEALANAAKNSLLVGLNGDLSGTCPGYTLHVTPAKSTPPSITTLSGVKLSLDDIATIVLTDGTEIKREEIGTLSGGRNENPKLEVLS